LAVVDFASSAQVFAAVAYAQRLDTRLAELVCR